MQLVVQELRREEEQDLPFKLAVRLAKLCCEMMILVSCRVSALTTFL